MKIGIFSDTHFGFGEQTERENECFENGLSAFRVCFEQKVDAIVIAGDVFDESLPSPETLSRSLDVFLHALREQKSDVTVKVTGKDGEKNFDFSGIPVIAIHGNHDARSIGKTNIMEVFSKSGFLAYLCPGKAVIQKGAETVCIFGLSAVPEKKARDVLRLWNPKPSQGYCNLLVLHQSFTEYLPFYGESIASLSLDDLPKGFDVIVNGHLHWTDTQKIGGSVFVLAGSTIVTQMKKLEAERKKGIFVFDSEKKSLDFFEFSGQRRLFYYSLKFENAKREDVVLAAMNAINESISKNDSSSKPLVRLVLGGSLALGVNSFDIDLRELIENTKTLAIVSVSKNFFSNSFKKKISDLRALQKSRQSVSSIGFEFLEKNLAQTDFNDAFDVKSVFDFLSENMLDEAAQIVLTKKT